MGDRYVVRERRVSDDLRARYPSIPAVTFHVWDTITDQKVPFSNAQRRSQAERTARRLNAKDTGS